MSESILSIRSAALRWVLVTFFAMLGLGFLAGTAGAQEVSQTGDNETEVSQSGNARAGDSIAGGQVIGGVNNGGNVTVTASNTSRDASAESGAATVNNSVGTVQTGPRVTAPASAAPPPGGVGVATHEGVPHGNVSQDGDNETEVDQSGDAETGDCLAGAQVFGFVGEGDVDIAASNDSDGDECESGESNVNNDIGAIFTGPQIIIFPLEPGPGPQADLAVDKEFVSGATNQDRSLVVFESTVTNAGPDTAENVVFEDAAPAGWTITDVQAPADWNCTLINNVLRCTKDEMAPGETAVFGVQFRNTDTTVAGVENTSAVTADTDDPNLENNSDTACATRTDGTWSALCPALE